MEIKVTSRHFKAAPEVREEAIKAANKFTRFSDKIISTEIVLSKEESHEDPKLVEYIVHIQDHTLVAKEEGQDFFTIIHDAAEKIIRQIRKLKTKASIKAD